MFSYLCYKCLNEKGNIVFLTLIMLRKYEMIMVSILNKLFMNIYIYICLLKIFMIESMVTLCYKDKV